MKKIILAMTLLFLASICYSQTIITPKPAQEIPPKGTKEYYLYKSKVKKIKGLIFTPVGAGLIVLGAGMAWAETANAITTIGQDEADGSAAGFVVVAGLVSMIGGTISFISAGQNKRKARSLAVGYEQVPSLQPGNAITKTVPTVGLKVAF